MLIHSLFPPNGDSYSTISNKDNQISAGFVHSEENNQINAEFLSIKEPNHMKIVYFSNKINIKAGFNSLYRSTKYRLHSYRSLLKINTLIEYAKI